MKNKNGRLMLHARRRTFRTAGMNHTLQAASGNNGAAKWETVPLDADMDEGFLPLNETKDVGPLAHMQEETVTDLKTFLTESEYRIAGSKSGPFIALKTVFESVIGRPAETKDGPTRAGQERPERKLETS